MKKYWDSLRSFEKRVLMALGAFFFVIGNLLFVRPYFSDWTIVQDRMFQAQQKQRVYQAEIDRKKQYEDQIKLYEARGGASVPQEDQANHFAIAVEAQAGQSRVPIVQQTHISYRTNQFFLELSKSINTQSGEPQLVDFLLNLGSGASLIRVQDLSLRPDPPRQNLAAGIKLIASYQKKAPVKAAAKPAAPTSTSARPAPGARPASAPPAAKPPQPTAKQP